MRQTKKSRFNVMAALTFGAALASAGGCVDDGVSVFIRQINTPMFAGTMCTLQNTVDAPRLYEGQLDLAFRESYVVSPLIQSQIVSRADPTANRVGAQVGVIEGFVVEVHDSAPDGPIIGRPFTIYQTVSLPSSITAGADSFASTQVQVIPPAIARQLTGVCQVDNTGVTADCPVPRYRSNDRRLIARISAFGHTIGGVQINTSPFDFPINVCCHCLIRFPTEANQPESTLAGGVTQGAGPDCNQGAATLDNSTCNLGQDFALDCRICSGRDPLLCQPRGWSPTGRRDCPVN